MVRSMSLQTRLWNLIKMLGESLPIDIHFYLKSNPVSVRKAYRTAPSSLKIQRSSGGVLWWILQKKADKKGVKIVGKKSVRIPNFLIQYVSMYIMTYKLYVFQLIWDLDPLVINWCRLSGMWLVMCSFMALSSCWQTKSAWGSVGQAPWTVF